MEKTIETIWKEGFLKEDAMIAPKVNDLYNRKSMDIIEKMMRMIRYNIIGLYLFAAFIFALTLFMGLPIWVSISNAGLFIAAGAYTQVQIKLVDKIEKNLSSYDYLKSFDAWLKDQLNRNIRLARFFYPAAVLSASMIIWFGDSRPANVEKLLQAFPDLILVGGVPLVFIMAISFLCILMAVFARKIYIFDVGLVYGRVFKKLDEILHDLETLRK